MPIELNYIYAQKERASGRASTRELCAATYNRIWNLCLQKTIKHYVSTVFISIGCSAQVNKRTFLHVFRLVQLHFWRTPNCNFRSTHCLK